MEKYCDNIFDKLYTAHEAELWYKARHFVMEELRPIDKDEYNDGISPCCCKHVHIVVDSIDEKMIAVVRQICLLAHYPNFNEEDGSNCTIITFCLESVPDDIMSKVKGLGNLLEYCKCTLYGKERKTQINYNPSQNDYLPLDIEFEFIEGKMDDFKKMQNDLLTKIEYKIVEESFKNYEPTKEGIDVTGGMLVNMVYSTGATINNLPACDNENIARYSTALNVFCYNLKSEEIKKTWKDCAEQQKDGTYREMDIKNQLSSIFCADCFDSRMKSFLDTPKKSVAEYLLYDFGAVMTQLRKQDTINALVRCEHARWNVEKLIMGFSPLNKQERYEIECLFGKQRNDKIKSLKKKFRHIDICSNMDLRRISPGDVKYDYFLMLAMPQILLSAIRL